MSSANSPYPLLFRPILKEKVWGGRRLAGLGKSLRAGALVGESWEIADLASTSPGGGGGEPARSTIRNGPFAGKTLHDAMALWGADLLGRASPASDGGFPLLIKLLDAHENLSVQVHPSPAYAKAHKEAHLKHEAWCVIAAEPGALIYRGFKPGVRRDEIRARLEDNTLAEALATLPARPGQIVHLPSGCVHALGAGALVAETQTASDTTYRLDDWGRTGRELHIPAALACAFNDDGSPTVPLESLPAPSFEGVRTGAFEIRRIAPDADRTMRLDADGSSPIILMALRGEIKIIASADQFEPITLGAGDVALLPASLAPAAAARCAPDAALLAITIPQG